MRQIPKYNFHQHFVTWKYAVLPPVWPPNFKIFHCCAANECILLTASSDAPGHICYAATFAAFWLTCAASKCICSTASCAAPGRGTCMYLNLFYNRQPVLPLYKTGCAAPEHGWYSAACCLCKCLFNSSFCYPWTCMPLLPQSCTYPLCIRLFSTVACAGRWSNPGWANRIELRHTPTELRRPPPPQIPPVPIL